MAIVGAGAIGCLFGARLKVAGNDVLLIDHNRRRIHEIERKGVKLRELDRTIQVRVPIGRAQHSLRRFQLVFFAVKAFNTMDAARQYAGRVTSEATILTLQNGLGNTDVLVRWFGRSRVVAGSTTEASLLVGDGSIAHTGAGQTVVGELDGRESSRCVSIVRVFRRAGFESKMTRNVGGVIWSKAIVNSAINPVSALTHRRNGELFRIRGLRELMFEIIDEGIRVSRAEGIRLEPRNLKPLLQRILKATGGNKSSMLQDVLRGSKTEIRELNGAIAGRGEHRRIPTPYNKFLTDLVLGLEGR